MIYLDFYELSLKDRILKKVRFFFLLSLVHEAQVHGSTTWWCHKCTRMLSSTIVIYHRCVPCQKHLLLGITITLLVLITTSCVYSVLSDQRGNKER